jgi:hypothetical protein
VDVTLAELAIESFHPGDEDTAFLSRERAGWSVESVSAGQATRRYRPVEPP